MQLRWDCYAVCSVHAAQWTEMILNRDNSKLTATKKETIEDEKRTEKMESHLHLTNDQLNAR